MVHGDFRRKPHKLPLGQLSNRISGELTEGIKIISQRNMHFSSWLLLLHFLRQVMNPIIPAALLPPSANLSGSIVLGHHTICFSNLAIFFFYQRLEQVHLNVIKALALLTARDKHAHPHPTPLAQGGPSGSRTVLILQSRSIPNGQKPSSWGATLSFRPLNQDKCNPTGGVLV